jgi:hypothetical protein
MFMPPINHSSTIFRKTHSLRGLARLNRALADRYCRGVCHWWGIASCSAIAIVSRRVVAMTPTSQLLVPYILHW